jgi:hypothetical protein
MGIPNTEVKRFVRAIQSLGARGAPFQFQTLRENVGIQASETARSAHAHNFVKELLSRGILEIVSGDRQRNRYYRIKSDWRLKALVQPNSPFSYSTERETRAVRKAVKSPRVRASAALAEEVDRESIKRIGDGIQKIYLRLENIEFALGELRALWK